MGLVMCVALAACGGRSGEAVHDTPTDTAAMRSDAAAPDSAMNSQDTTATGGAQPREPNQRERVTAPRVPGDTVRATVSVEGAEPMTRVMLRSQGSAREVAGPHARTLSRLDGVTVLARGKTSGNILTVDEFIVTAVNGEPVLDGRVVEDGERVTLVTMDGRRVELRAVPAALRALAGHRVWMRTSANGEPESWRQID